MVIGRRDLHHIRTDDVEPAQPAQHRQHLGGGGAARHRRPGAGGKGWIEAVYVEGDIGRSLSDMSEDDFGNLLSSHLLEVEPVQDADTAIFRRMRADAHLNGAGWVDDVLAHGAAYKGAVIHALAVIRPGVLMRVELDEGKRRAMFFRVRPEQRPGDEMISAERDEKCA